jgi:hypothetical protein
MFQPHYLEINRPLPIKFNVTQSIWSSGRSIQYLHTKQTTSAEGITNGMLISVLIKLVIRKENVANMRKGSDM